MGNAPKYIKFHGATYRLANDYDYDDDHDDEVVEMTSMIANLDNQLEQMFDAEGHFVADTGPKVGRDYRGPGHIYTEYYKFRDLPDSLTSHDVELANALLLRVNKHIHIFQKTAPGDPERPWYSFSIVDLPQKGWSLLLERHAYDV